VCKQLARVAQISSIDDYRKVLEVAKRYDKMKKRWCIDWEKLAMLCDGLWLTEDGLYSVGYAEFEVEYPELVSFYGWDAESIVWFRWVLIRSFLCRKFLTLVKFLSDSENTLEPHKNIEKI